MTVSKSQHQDFLKLNQEPLNQQAKRLLELAGEDPNPDCLYLLQLAVWGLESREVGKPEQEREMLLEKVYRLMDWPNPEKAFRYLLDNRDDPEGRLLDDNDLDDVTEPWYGASIVLDALEQAMMQP